ncbi:LLM class flavin-dependent oxidoreductase, partial [Streptomyces sp. NPDC055078]
MSATRSLHLAVALDGPARYDAGHYVDLARLAERGALDFVTLGDSFARPGLDALAVLSRVAPATHRIGLVPTVTATHTDPLRLATAVATLDWVSRGRAGWAVGVAATQTEARLFGRGPAGPAAKLWREAADTAGAVVRLWDGGDYEPGSHEPGSHRPASRAPGSRDQATECFTDGGEPHRSRVPGRTPAAREPFAGPRPPQGRPVTVVDLTGAGAGAGDEGRRAAARYADVVLVRATSPDSAAAIRAAVHEDARRQGRDPGTLRVLLSLAVDLGGSEPPPEPGLTGPDSLPR